MSIWEGIILFIGVVIGLGAIRMIENAILDYEFTETDSEGLQGREGDRNDQNS